MSTDWAYTPDVQEQRDSLGAEDLEALESFFNKIDSEGVSYAIENYLPDELADHPDQVIEDLYSAGMKVVHSLDAFRRCLAVVRTRYGIEES